MGKELSSLEELRDRSEAMRILLKHLDEFDVAHTYYWIDDRGQAFDAIEAAMEEYADPL